MKLTATIRRKFRIRNKLKKVSSTDRLRLSITRSTKNISAQLIDDKKQSTILSASSNEKDMRSVKKNKIDISILVAEKLYKTASMKQSKYRFLNQMPSYTYLTQTMVITITIKCGREGIRKMVLKH